MSSVNGLEIGEIKDKCSKLIKKYLDDSKNK